MDHCQHPPPRCSRLFMLTHGKEVRKVSFLLIDLKALSCTALRLVLWVSFRVMRSNFLTFITVKNSKYKTYINQ